MIKDNVVSCFVFGFELISSAQVAAKTFQFYEWIFMLNMFKCCFKCLKNMHPEKKLFG